MRSNLKLFSLSFRAVSVLILALFSGVLASCAATSGDARGEATVAAGPRPGMLEYDKSVFNGLLQDHQKIHRSVTPLPNGIEAVTESDDPEVAARIKDHVLAMKQRLHDGRRMRQWDPLYVAVFNDADQITLEVTPTEKGVRVVETSDDPHAAEVIRIHAGVVSGFARQGFDEAALAHEVPARGDR